MPRVACNKIPLAHGVHPNSQPAQNVRTLQSAVKLGIVAGAPNLVRGASHSGNVSALELARERLLDALSSDYVPVSLLHAAFLLESRGGFRLPDAIATVSANPARLAGLTDRGEIAVGLRADFIRVRLISGVPVVLGAWRAGRPNV